MGSSFETRNFGFRRMTTNTVREGRFRAPDDTALRLGGGVEIDLADPTRVRTITDNATGVGGADTRSQLVGILWYEHDSQTYVGRPAGTLLIDYDTAPIDRMVQLVHGPGTKVWFRNTDANTTEPGLNYANTRDAVTIVTGLGAAGVAVGDLLGWDGTSAWEVTVVPEEAILTVTFVDDTIGLCEAVMLV